MSPHRVLPISVVIPTYGRGEYIVAAVESAATGPDSPREIIVVDDGSVDDTAQRLAPLVRENRIRYHYQSNAGMAAARNTGAALATSKYVYFLDDDDLTFPRALTTLVEELEAHPESAIACGEMVIFSGEPPDPPATCVTRRDVDFRQFLRFNPVGSSGQVLVRRSAFEAARGFHLDYPATEDWDLWLRLVERHPARWVTCPVLAYRLHGGNTSRNVARMNKSSMRVARRHLSALPPSDRTLASYITYRALRDYHAPRLRAMAVENARRGDWAHVRGAVREWIDSNATAVWAGLRLKARLASEGRWRLREDEFPAA